jgi:hypothetical protein
LDQIQPSVFVGLTTNLQSLLNTYLPERAFQQSVRDPSHSVQQQQPPGVTPIAVVPALPQTQPTAAPGSFVVQVDRAARSDHPRVLASFDEITRGRMSEQRGQRFIFGSGAFSVSGLAHVAPGVIARPFPVSSRTGEYDLVVSDWGLPRNSFNLRNIFSRQSILKKYA